MSEKIISMDDFLHQISGASISEQVDLARKYILHGIPFVFIKTPDAYYDFRNKIANHFDISYRDVYIVGSAKLGYSYFKKTQFSLESDIDIAIVSKELFEKYQQTICDFQYDLDNCCIQITYKESVKYFEFLRYFAKGWLRPDKLPFKGSLENRRNEWFDYFKTLSYGKSEVGNYKVSAGLYKDYYSLEKYIVNSFNPIGYENK